MMNESLLAAKYSVILTGPGAGTKSGQKNYRTNSYGLWNLEDFLRFSEPEMTPRNKHRCEEIYKTCIKELEDYEQSRVHEILSKWERSGLIKSIITENVDGLHQAAGSRRVFELYGTVRSMHCTRCGITFTMYKYHSESPAACYCGGFVRPSVVLSYESIPKKQMDIIREEVLQSDFLILLGVSPSDVNVYLLAKLAKDNDAKLAVITDEPTPLDEYGDIVIREKDISKFLCSVDGKIVSDIKQ